MSVFAHFDHTAPAPQKVIGWYDATTFDYPDLPASDDLIALDDAQWAAVQAGDPNAWAVSGGALVAYTPPAAPAPTLAQSAALASVSGLTITLTGSVTLAATLFPTDAVTQSKIGAVITTLAATGAFPGGGSSYPMKDATTNGPNGEGAWHTFTAAEYRTVAGAISTFVAGCDLIADGNPFGATELPSSSVTIPV